MKARNVILFDFDGVLVDTFFVCYGITKELNPDMPAEEYRSFFEGNIYNSMERAGAQKRMFHAMPDFFRMYEERSRKLVVPEELKTLVRKLAKTADLVVISSTTSALIQDILIREGLSDCFAEVLGSDVHTNKTIKIGMVLEKYGKKPGETIFVTDTTGDVAEAKECGVASVAVTWGFHDRARLEEAHPLAVVDTPRELADALEKFFAAVY